MNHQELDQHKNLLVNKRSVSGELASWAVRQSPYPAPEGLTEAITEFLNHWKDFEEYQVFPSMSNLRAAITVTIGKVPQIVAWNSRKNGRDGPGFSSRFDGPAADDDFIDLDALARNVAMAAWNESVENK